MGCAELFYHVPVLLSNNGGNRILQSYRLLLVLLLSSAYTVLSGAYPHQDSTFKASDSTAHIFLIASDNAGNLVPAPVRESVQLHIGAQPVEIEEIRSLKDSPLFFSVLVDLSGSSKQFADQQIAATTELFQELSTGNNHGYLILFKSELATNDHFVSIAEVESIMKRFPAQTRSGGTALYDALIHAATEQLASTRIPRDSRRAIFVLSDGGDNSSYKPLHTTLKTLQQEHIPVFSIGFSRSQDKRDLENLKALNDATGGWGTFLDEPGDGVARAAGLASGQCLVLFKPPALKPKKSYRLRIQSSSAVRIMAPKEYVLP